MATSGFKMASVWRQVNVNLLKSVLSVCKKLFAFSPPNKIDFFRKSKKENCEEILKKGEIPSFCAIA